ncbi:MAG: hypothetical protein K6T26_06660 [Alicyclobacillus sp.]|nr:hypothetical protein [Alicyclobacillus sp.]
MKTWRQGAAVLLAGAWALFVNLCNVWLIRPLADDGSVLGVLAGAMLALLWLSCLPPHLRRQAISFTLFCLLLGGGWSALMVKPWLQRLLLGVVMTVGLAVLAWLTGRVARSRLLAAVACLVLANFWLPLDQWTFLTHFAVVYHTRVPFSPVDLPALPLQVVDTGNGGQAVLTLANLRESQQQVLQAATHATDSPTALEEVLRDYGHRYQLLELQAQGGRLRLIPAAAADLRSADPGALFNSVFPFVVVRWQASGQRILQYMVPAAAVDQFARWLLSPGDLPAHVSQLALWLQTEERASWTNTLLAFGVTPAPPSLHVVAGRLTGTSQGHSWSIPVDGNTLVGVGAFTAPGAHEALVLGVNTLQLVSLDRGVVLGTYHGDTDQPLAGDLVIGPLDGSGRDVVFVNSSPARILSFSPAVGWQTVYTAPNPSLRFEASVRFPGDNQPEILTDDPSLVRDSPVRYFTSYTFRNGQLVRNWRVYQTNVVNVQSVQFQPGTPPELALTLYGSGHLLVLRRHDWPVVPSLSVLLAGVMLSGWMYRWQLRRARLHGHSL